VNASEGKGKEKGDKKRKELRTCHHCGKVGHIKKNCWQLHEKTNGERIRGETDKEKEKASCLLPRLMYWVIALTVVRRITCGLVRVLRTT
jgi:hypothetical protein